MRKVKKVENFSIHIVISGFICHVDTHSSAMKCRDKIVELLKEEAALIQREVTEMVEECGVFHGTPLNGEDWRELNDYLSGGAPETGPITTSMAWCCAGEVC